MQTTKPLGFNGANGKMDVLITPGTALPAAFKRNFGTWMDDQEIFDVDFYEGDNEMYEQNTFLGNATIDGIPKNKVDQEKCLMTGKLTKSGMLEVKLAIQSMGKSKEFSMDVPSIFASAQA